MVSDAVLAGSAVVASGAESEAKLGVLLLLSAALLLLGAAARLMRRSGRGRWR